MGIPRLDSCCCGCTLRTGTLILLYLSLVGSLLAPFGNPPTGGTNSKGTSETKEVSPAAKIPAAIIGVIISACGLYGVYKERHAFLIPYLIFDSIFVIGVIIVAVMILIINVLAGLIYFLFALIPIYFWLIVYNHYRELEEGKRSSSAA